MDAKTYIGSVLGLLILLVVASFGVWIKSCEVQRLQQDLYQTHMQLLECQQTCPMAPVKTDPGVK